MSYIVLQDLLDELGEETLVQLTDNDETGEINQARVNKAIESAKGTFDFYARTRYSLPVPATPMVKAFNLDLAIFSLYKTRSTIDEGVYKIRKNANDEAIKHLVAMSQGKGALDVPAIEETVDNPATSDRILTNKSNAKFTDNKLSGF